MTAEHTMRGVLDSVLPGKSGTKQDGTAFQIYDLMMNGQKYGTFDKKVYEQAYAFFTQKSMVTMQVVQKGNFWNVKSIWPAAAGAAPTAPAPAAPPAGAPTQDQKDIYWQNKAITDAEKDQRISMHGAMNTAVEIYKINHLGNTEITDDEILTACKATAEKILTWLKEKPK